MKSSHHDMTYSRHDMPYSRHDNSAVCREKISSSRHHVIQRDSMVKANLTPGTVSDQSFGACSQQSVSFTVFRTADVSLCFGAFLPGVLLTAST